MIHQSTFYQDLKTIEDFLFYWTLLWNVLLVRRPTTWGGRKWTFL